jgi:type VI secretion system protein ImpC
VELGFRGIADFEPAQVARQVGPLRELLETRRGMDPRSGSPDPDAAASGRLAEIDARLSVQVREILHHPDFQALESTWRGLHYLVMQTETSQVLKIRVWNVDKHELASDFASASELADTALFKSIDELEYGTFGGAPFGVLVGAYAFDRSPEDVELLEHISRVAATSYAPFLAAASPRMLGLDSFASLADVRDVERIFESPDAATWNTFRNSEDARYVGLTLPRVLLRLPYGRETVPVEELGFEEVVDGSDQARFLWGSAAFVLAARITEAFARYGWCVAIRGAEGGGLVEGLPAYTFRSDEGDVAMKSATEIAITDRRELELSRAGFIPLVHARDTDYAVFFSVNSVQVPRTYESPEATANARLAAQLPAIFAVSRFAHSMRCMARDKIGSFTSPEQMERWLNQWVSNYVTPDDDATPAIKAQFPLREARIEVEAVEGKPGAYRAAAFLRPHFQLDGLTTSLRVVMELPARSW